MKSRLDEFEPSIENPFEKCKLQREQNAMILTKVVASYNEGCIMSINGKWGTGKTTFIKMWNAYLNKKEYKTLYYNAWEEDFVDDPIISILGELNKYKDLKGAKEKMEDVLTTACKIGLGIAPAIAKGFTKKFTGVDIDEIASTAEEAVKAGAKLIEKRIEKYEEQKTSLKNFKSELTNLINEITENKPIVFFIDELDRCNPAFAVKTLERIKHLFNVPRIVFVLSIDREQLQHAICGYYGSDSIDSQEYLRRFIDIEYSLPEPNINDFCEYVYNYYDYNSIINNRKDYYGYRNEFPFLINIVSMYFVAKATPLRLIDRVFSNARLVLDFIDSKDPVYIDIILMLVIYKISEPDIYDKIQHHEYTIQEFFQLIEKSFAYSITTSKYTMGYMQQLAESLARMILCYHQDRVKDNFINDKAHFYVLDGSSIDIIKIKTLDLTPKFLDKEDLLQALNKILQQRKENNITRPGIDYFIEKIDLLSDISS